MGREGRQELHNYAPCKCYDEPLVNVIHSFFAYEPGIDGIAMTLITAVLEIAAVIAEWLVYKSRTDIKKPFLFSLCANGFSFLCGILINIFLR